MTPTPFTPASRCQTKTNKGHHPSPTTPANPLIVADDRPLRTNLSQVGLQRLKC